MSTEENKTIVRRLFQELWNQGNPAVANELIEANCIFQNPILPGAQ